MSAGSLGIVRGSAFRLLVLLEIKVDQWVRVIWILFPSPAPYPARFLAERIAPQFTLPD